MALAETASIFCETLVVEAGLARLEGAERLALLDVDLVGSNQVVVDIHCRFLFETEVFARRQRRTLGVDRAQRADARRPRPTPTATGSTVDTRTRTCGCSSRTTTGRTSTTGRTRTACCSGSGCSPSTRRTPSASAPATTTLLSRAGMDTAEELGAAFGIDVTDEEFWTASLDVCRARIAEYERARRRAADERSTRLGRDTDALRRHAATSSPRSARGHSRATGSTRCGTGCTSSSATPDELDEPAAGAARPSSPSGCRRRWRPSPSRSATTGDTVKFLWELDGGSRIETVLMLYPDRATVCVSSQAGCAMACGFCATGQAGFTRHLTTGEIVEQVVARRARGREQLDRRAAQRRVHGDGRAAGQRGRGVGRGRAHPRRPRPVGAAHHDVARSGSCRASASSPRGRCRSTSPCRCTPPTTSCATSWCRSTAATRSTT